MGRKFIKGLFVFLFATTMLGGTSVFSANQALLDAARKEGTVILYHSMPRRVLSKLAEQFERKYGIKVKWTRKGTGGIIRMVRAERLAGALKCDIVSTGDPTSFIRWKKEGVLMKYVSPNTSQFFDSIIEPGGWYTPSRTTYVSMAYSTKRVKKDEAPKSWEDVLDPKWKGRIAVVDPRKSGPARWWLGAMVFRFGWGYFEKLAKNKPLLLKSSASSATSLLSGEADILVLASEHDLIRRAEKGEPVKPIYPVEGLVYKTSRVGICKSASHINAAKLWINWETSAEGQSLISKHGGNPPVRKDVKPFHFRSPKVIEPSNVIGVNHEWFLKHKKELMKKFSKIMAGEKNSFKKLKNILK